MSRRAYQSLIWTANRLATQYGKAFFCTVLKPIDYTRTREIPVLLDLSGILQRQTESLRILDIGSPQILSLTLAAFSNRWQVVYVNSHPPELADLVEKAAQIGLTNVLATKADIADHATLQDLGQFDVIFSCSVFEHIHPEEGGDVAAAANIAALLCSDGVFNFSVPYYIQAFNEYRSGSVYAVEGREGERTFFQRFYDEKTVTAQIIEPSQLSLIRKRYIGERNYYPGNISKRFAFLVDFGNISFFLGRFYRTLSTIFMREADDYRLLKKPYLFICTLKKS